MWEVGGFYTPENPDNFRPSLILIENWDVVIWFDQVKATQLAQLTVVIPSGMTFCTDEIAPRGRCCAV